MAGHDEDADLAAPAPPTDTEVVSEGGAEHLVVRGCSLAVIAGPDAGASQAARGPRIVIGTHPSADLALADRTVSRFHCELELEAGRPLLRDLGSRNGTLLDGVSVLAARPVDGSIITIGRTRIRFDLGTDRLKIPLGPPDRFGSLVGRSVAMRSVFALLARAAEHDVTVLLQGETGTGKEGAAESIHRASRRRDGPFVVVDCGAIPDELVESELFGHERGAFTGAVAARPGVFEAASGGTIFLDEIGELPLELQPKLLRVLERREVKRVGASRYQPVDVRIVAATNRSLRGDVNARRFRSDLYYRIAVLEIVLPPLRDRPEDLPPLVEHLLGEMGGVDRAEAARLATPEFLAGLGHHAWPGNVRELRNHLERCLATRSPAIPEASDPEAGLSVDIGEKLPAERERWVRALERRYLERVLEANKGNVSAAARQAGIDRIFFYRLLWRHGLR